MTVTSRLPAALIPLLLLACRPASSNPTFALEADRFDNAEWSEPVNLSSVVNSSAVDANAALSPDVEALSR